MGNKINFEQGIEKLEEIVTKLESGSVSLDESFKEYEKGVKLYKELKKLLAEGEAKIIQLTQKDLDVKEDSSDEDT